MCDHCTKHEKTGTTHSAYMPQLNGKTKPVRGKKVRTLSLYHQHNTVHYKQETLIIVERDKDAFRALLVQRNYPIDHVCVGAL